MVQAAILCVGFVMLIKGADWLVDGASTLGRRLSVPPIVIGLTVVAFGTSAPELFVNLIAAIQGSTALAFSNVVGSNLANILLVLGLSAVICPLCVERGTAWREIPFCILSACVLGVMVNDRLFDQGADMISRGDGLVLLGFFLIFLYYSASLTLTTDYVEEQIPERPLSFQKSLIFVGLGLAGLLVGGYLIVESARAIAAAMGMEESFVGLTIVAVGTSLPELATSLTAAWKGNVDIAVGNVVGSNIFNTFLVLGTTSTVKAVPWYTGGWLDMGLMILSTCLLFVFMFTGRKKVIDRFEGALMVGLYIGFMAVKGLGLA